MHVTQRLSSLPELVSKQQIEHLERLLLAHHKRLEVSTSMESSLNDQMSAVERLYPCLRGAPYKMPQEWFRLRREHLETLNPHALKMYERKPEDVAMMFRAVHSSRRPIKLLLCPGAIHSYNKA